MELISYIIGIILVIASFLFAYVSSHIISERKAGHTIPLPWENKDKSYGVSSGEQKSKKKHMDDILW